MSAAILASYATQRQLDYLQAVEKHGSHNKAAKALGVSRRTVDLAMQALKSKAAAQGYSPDHDMTKTVPHGFTVKGVSTYYDERGKPRGQWVKSTTDDVAREEAMREAFEALAQDVARLPPAPLTAATQDHLANLFVYTDCHVGMLAWGKETGADWDLNIAERTLVGCFEQMVRAAPPAKTAIVCQLGDFLHQDSIEPVTPTSRHLLDADGRFSKVVATAVRILRQIVDMALAKHEQVVVVMAEGNHDVSSSIWLRVMFKALYENEPRVSVIDSELPYYCHQHGSTMLAFHHGHIKKNDELPILFASQYPKVWGATTKRYAHTGHRHHIEEKEHSGMVVIQHPTLAARDAYAARGGWIAERQIRAITYHAQHGEVARNSVTPEMLA